MIGRSHGNDLVDQPPTVIRSAMLITLRFPRSSALKLNLVVADTDGQEQDSETTLTAVELAGRLSLATGKPISPTAVAGYCAAWRAATEAHAQLAKKHGTVGLGKLVRQASSDRALWAPRTNSGALKWLQCILECHYLSRGDTESRTQTPGAPAAEDQDAALELGKLCEENFSHAYGLWLASERSVAPNEVGLTRRRGPSTPP